MPVTHNEIIKRINIVNVVSQYTSLKKTGNYYLGICRLHNGRAFTVYVMPEQQIFHSFDCGISGDAVSFIMKIEDLSYDEAVHYLAGKIGIETPKKNTSETIRLFHLCKDAARFYFNNLYEDKAQSIRNYFIKRGLTTRTMRIFGLGFASDSYFGLITAMKKKGYTEDELIKAGLCKSSNGTVYDRFRNRAIFPIFDVHGEVIGFGGRALDCNKPKYLNSPETMIYHKGKSLFALHRACKTKKNYFILSEGFMDAVALHQAGFDSAIASLGTALTEQQANIISRYTENVIIAYDSDNAGSKATQRAAEILKKAGLNVKALNIPGAKDPDEYIKANGADAFRSLLKSAIRK